MITSASGSTFAKNPTDWKWWHPSVPTRLKELTSDGYARALLLCLSRCVCRADIWTSYQIVIVSNQKQIAIQPKAPKKPSATTNDSKAGESKSLSNFKQRASAMLSTLDLNVPLSVYAATENDEFRKPRMGMWREFLDDYDLDVAGVDLGKSFFVGDAAGRKGDHSQVDRCVSKHTYLYMII